MSERMDNDDDTIAADDTLADEALDRMPAFGPVQRQCNCIGPAR